MSRAEFRIGDVFDRLAEIPDGTIDLVLTSPPFLALRSYLPADHPDKAKEIGSEANPAEFIDTLLRLSAEWRRVLAPHGSIAVELGDTYSGSGGDNNLWTTGYSGGTLGHATKKPAGSGKTRDISTGWPQAKSLCFIPELYGVALAYGINPLTGQPSPAGQWRVRNVVAWCRPNPSVGALGDKFRPATSYLTVATVARDRYFDLDAVREPASPNSNPRTAKGVESRQRTEKTSPDTNRHTMATIHSCETRPPYDHWWHDDQFEQDAWLIATEPYSGSHYATWPRALLTRPILAMCPERVCTVCGEPSRRIVESVGVGMSGRGLQTTKLLGGGRADQSAGWERVAVTTLGWTDCGCSTDGSHWRRGVVLDPFGGSGSTAAVATGLGRDCVLIDIDHRNADLAQERVGMFLEVTA